MQTRPFGRLGTVTALSMGGGGIGQVWGSTSREEAVATLREAIDAGITLIDVAPAYGKGEAEEVVGEAFGGKPTRWRPAVHEGRPVRALVNRARPANHFRAHRGQPRRQLSRRLRVEHLDLLYLHDQIVPDGEASPEPGTPLQLFQDVVRPALQQLVTRGRIGAWGISARGVVPALLEAINAEEPPAAAQIVANALVFEPRLAEACQAKSVAAVGIQPTHSGALTDAFDRPVQPDMAAFFDRAAPFRALAAELGQSPAYLAHRYALALPGVSTVTLGVKNRAELRQALEAETAGPLPADIVDRIHTALRLGST